MDSEQLKALYEQYFYYILFADIAIGLLFGLVPLILGLKRNKRNMGFIALIISALVGVLSPLLSLIVAVVFIVLILRKPVTGMADAPDAAIHTSSPE